MAKIVNISEIHCGAGVGASMPLSSAERSGFALNSVTDISPNNSTNDRNIVLQRYFCIILVIFPHLLLNKSLCSPCGTSFRTGGSVQVRFYPIRICGI